MAETNYIMVWELYIERIMHVDHYVYRVERYEKGQLKGKRHMFIPIEAGTEEWLYVVHDQYPDSVVTLQHTLPWNEAEGETELE